MPGCCPLQRRVRRPPASRLEDEIFEALPEDGVGGKAKRLLPLPHESLDVRVVEGHNEAAVVCGRVPATTHEELLVLDGATHEDSDLAAAGREPAAQLVELGIAGIA